MGLRERLEVGRTKYMALSLSNQARAATRSRPRSAATVALVVVRATARVEWALTKLDAERCGALRPRAALSWPRPAVPKVPRLVPKLVVARPGAAWLAAPALWPAGGEEDRSLSYRGDQANNA